MKKIIFILLLFVIFTNSVFGEGNGHNPNIEDHEITRQIKTYGLADIQSFQNMNNKGAGSFVLIQQLGNGNKLNVSQQSDTGDSFSNLAYNIQQGNSNEMTVGQIGSGNVFLGFQLGYVICDLGSNQENLFGFGQEIGNENANISQRDHDATETIIVGERNKLVISQEGSSNSVMAVQQGSDNTITAEQKGTNNYLLLYQKGKNNSVTGYSQENSSGKTLLETVIQIGEDLSLNTSDVSKSKPNGNTFIQNGVNLSLQVNNEFANTLGGIEINQTGRDMKVVVDQSFFSFPMK